METMEATDVMRMKIRTPAEIVEALRDLGYHAKKTDEGVITGVSLTEEDGSSRDFPILITEDNGSLEFNCQLCTVGDLEQLNEEQRHDHEEHVVGDNVSLTGENTFAVLAWVFLYSNAKIQPWAIALIGSSLEFHSSDTIILTDSVPLGDFSSEELQSAMTTLLQALANVAPNIYGIQLRPIWRTNMVAVEPTPTIW